MLTQILIGLLILISSAGIAFILKGQSTIKIEASKGRKAIHEKLDKFTERVIVLETFHKINHPEQTL